MAQPFPNELKHLYDNAEFIGSGGFAKVFKARRKDSRVVAVKIPLKLDEVTGKSFLREITSWQRLNHQNIVALFDANILPIPYLEQEYMDGGSLEAIKKPLEIVKACKIVFEIAEGLKYAHKQGIVHRDLKPQNVLLTKDNVPKITDWGMSRVVDAFKSSTQQGYTPAYAAPEQVSPKKFGKPDERTDIYQLGVILYNLITNDLPFKGDDLVEIASAIVMEEPIPPSKSNPEAWEVELIVLRCLSKKKENRYQSVEELQEKLFELIEKERERKEKEEQERLRRIEEERKAREEQERLRKQREEEERAKKEREEQEKLRRREEERKVREEQERLRKQMEEEERAKKEREEQERLRRIEEERTERELKAKEEQERRRKQREEEERAKKEREEQERLQRKEEDRKEKERKAREKNERKEGEEAERREKERRQREEERLRRQIEEAKTRKRDELNSLKEKRSPQKILLAVALVLSALLLGWMFPFGSTNAPETINSTPSPTPNIASTEVQYSVTPTVSPTQIAKTPPTTLTNSIGMEFSLIPAGEFYMGSPESEKDRDPVEGPVHHVNISQPFYMGKYKVTQKQWSDVMGNNPSNLKGDDLPVEQVSWYDVQNFIKKLNEKEGKNKYRLPSEAEWEYAVRAGTNTTYFFGENISELGDYAWYSESSGRTHPVGQKKPNPWGLYDLRGNGFEWMQDIYHGFYGYNGAPTDGSAWEGVTSEGGVGSKRVLRGSGGCTLYNNMDFQCRSASRYSEAQGIRSSEIGFRLVMETNNTVNQTPDVTPPVSLIPIITPNLDQKTFTNSIGMEFVQIPAGEFDMGSSQNEAGRDEDESPVHRVKIANAFYMGKYEVTQKQWHDIMGTDPSYFKGDNLPVEQVSLNDVQEFIRKLNEKEGMNKYRLPSEAEWEYVARAGTTTRYSFGDDESKLGEYAWYNANSGRTHEVGQKKPNPWGLYDMHGNVWERVPDSNHGGYNGAPTNGSAWIEYECKPKYGCQYIRVARGGSWGYDARNLRSAARGDYVYMGRSYDADVRDRNLGFRLLRSL